jgi:hypothetical protein
MTDSRNCGACRNACPQGIPCINGSCGGTGSTPSGNGGTSGVKGATYTSPTWGYAFSWNGTSWKVQPDSEVVDAYTSFDGTDHNDIIILNNGTSRLAVGGYEDISEVPGDPSLCLNQNIANFGEGLDNFQPGRTASGAYIYGLDDVGAAYAAYTYTFDQVEMAVYLDCRTLVPNQAVLVRILVTPMSQYGTERSNVQAVFQTLRLPEATQQGTQSGRPTPQPTCASAGEECRGNYDCCGEVKCRVSPMGGFGTCDPYCGETFAPCSSGGQCCSGRCIMGGCSYN